jgi:hypothetical protein
MARQISRMLRCHDEQWQGTVKSLGFGETARARSSAGRAHEDVTVTMCRAWLALLVIVTLVFSRSTNREHVVTVHHATTGGSGM